MTRLYEWRYTLTGQKWQEPKAALNACHFYARAVRDGEIQAPPPDTFRTKSDSPNSLSVHVTATGEHCSIGFKNGRASLFLSGLPYGFWYDADGKVVPAP